MQKAISGQVGKTWSSAEGAAVVAEWRKSGMSAEQFCRDRGINFHRLRYWCGRERKKASQKDFVVVPAEIVPDAVQAAGGHDSLTVEFQVDRLVARVPLVAGAAFIFETMRTMLEVA